MIHANLPSLFSWGLVVSLIFGGCCSNVFALETIVKEEPDSGLLITFSQFLFVAVMTWPSHFSPSHPPLFLKPRAIPLRVWIPNIMLFCGVNMLNNFAFGYNISVPVHIILRSGGSITTMLVGYIWGTRYTRVQVLSVAMLTIGVILAAMTDAQSKGRTSTQTSTPLDGLLILALAQLLSAIMGLYIQITYAKYGSHWHENLFYSHFLSLPLFLPFTNSLVHQFRQLLSSPALHLSFPTSWKPPSAPQNLTIPTHVASLALNALTQYVCIRGVNSLAAHTSAIGVTIVLNLRKLVSLFVSISLFGNRLPGGVILGAAIVFSSAAVWAWEGQRIRRRGEGKKSGGDGQGTEREREKKRTINGDVRKSG